MRRTGEFSIFVVGALIAVSAATANASECKIINTDLVGQIAPCVESPVGLCAPATAGSGLLKGGKSFTFLGLAPSAGLPSLEPATVLSYSGPVVYYTDRGELHLNAIGVLDQVRLIFTEMQRVTGGTGDFAGATGALFISGNSTGVEPSGVVPFKSKITGELCLQK
jgi:hypothetical protein